MFLRKGVGLVAWCVLLVGLVAYHFNNDNVTTRHVLLLSSFKEDAFDVSKNLHFFP